MTDTQSKVIISSDLQDGRYSEKSRLHKGDYFKFPEGKTVYIFDGKDRKYGFRRKKFDDVNDYQYTKTNRKVVVDFTF